MAHHSIAACARWRRSCSLIKCCVLRERFFYLRMMVTQARTLNEFVPCIAKQRQKPSGQNRQARPKIYLPAGRVRGIYKAPLGRILAAHSGGFSAPDCEATGAGGRSGPEVARLDGSGLR